MHWYEYTDAGAGTTEASDPRPEWNEDDFHSLQGRWAAHAKSLRDRFDQQAPSSPSYASDREVTRRWRDGVATLFAGAPADPPENSIAIADRAHGGWSDEPPERSLWREAWSVRYAFAWLDANGPSERSGWLEFDMYDVDSGGQRMPKWKPTLRHLPTSDREQRQLQIWRQFVLGPGVPNREFVPQLIATVPRNGVQLS